MYLPPYSPELNPIEKCWGGAEAEDKIIIISKHSADRSVRYGM